MQDEQGFEHRFGSDLERAVRQALDARPCMLPPTQGALPSRVDLRADCSPVADQGDLGACTAFAVGQGARECLQRSRGEAPTPLSPLFLYYAIRSLRNAVDRDSGGTVTDAMVAIAGTGVPPETAWPYDVDVFDRKPSRSSSRSSSGCASTSHSATSAPMASSGCRRMATSSWVATPSWPSATTTNAAC